MDYLLDSERLTIEYTAEVDYDLSFKHLSVANSSARSMAQWAPLCFMIGCWQAQSCSGLPSVSNCSNLTIFLVFPPELNNNNLLLKTSAHLNKQTNEK